MRMAKACTRPIITFWKIRNQFLESRDRRIVLIGFGLGDSFQVNQVVFVCRFLLGDCRIDQLDRFAVFTVLHRIVDRTIDFRQSCDSGTFPASIRLGFFTLVVLRNHRRQG